MRIRPLCHLSIGRKQEKGSGFGNRWQGCYDPERMKIVSLNTYGGNVFEPLMEFVERHAPDTDVFCFQEMMDDAHGKFPQPEKGARLNLLEEMTKRLPNFQRFFSLSQEKFDFDETNTGSSDLGLAIFVRNGISVKNCDNFFIYKGLNTLKQRDYSTLGYNALFVQLDLEKPLTICTLHGTSEPGHKLDSPERIAQSKKILDKMQKLTGEKIILGDFNLLPDTESIRMFAENGYRNLVLEHDIKTTRGSNNRKLHPQYEHGKYGFQEFADYTFVTPGIHVKAFSVPDEPISDHLPMILEIEP